MTLLNRGFTLIELLVVVLIIGILAAIALPQYQLAVYKTRFQKIRPLLHSLANAQEAYYMENGKYAENLQDLAVSFPSSCTYTLHPEWAFDVLDCPDVQIDVGRHYHALTGAVKKCPKGPYGGNACAVYVVPYAQPYAPGSYLFGNKPACMVSRAGGMTEEARAYGRKVCLSLGGKKLENQTDVYELP